jgi:hypothetical protein
MRKGLSQILWLIISASVLMMLALTVVALGQGGLQNLVTQTGQTGCTQAINSQMRLMDDMGRESRPIPSTCFDNGEPIENTQVPTDCEPGDQFYHSTTGNPGWECSGS